MRFTTEIFKMETLKPAIYQSEVERLERFIDKSKGKRVFVLLEAEKKGRSDNQNRFYWGVALDILSEHTGFTAEELHEILKHKFLQYWTVIPAKEKDIEVQTVKSTTELSTSEFEEYLTKIKQWASIELGCVIPDPNEGS